jgi:hypothetical protein
MHPAVAKLADKDRAQFRDLATGKMGANSASKETLVAAMRVITGSGGDYDRTPRLTYVTRVEDTLRQGGENARKMLLAAVEADDAEQANAIIPPPVPVAVTPPVAAQAPVTQGAAVPNAGALTQLAQALKGLGIGGVDPEQVKAIVDSHIGDIAETIKAAVAKETRRVVVVTPDGVERDMGLQHAQFPALLNAMSCRDSDGNRLNLFLVGPPGSGKTRACSEASKALGLDYAFNGAIDTEYKLLGFTDAMGRVVSRPFRRIYENGGVYLFDEVDGSMPAALLALNAALANGECDFPDGMVKRHPDCIIVAAGNTWGFGATSDFVGRNKLDAASRDRFTFLNWPIDESLERKIAPDADWCAYVQKCRTVVQSKGLKILVTPRATFKGCALLAAGFTRQQAAEMAMFAGLSPEQVAMFPKP